MSCFLYMLYSPLHIFRSMYFPLFYNFWLISFSKLVQSFFYKFSLTFFFQLITFLQKNLAFEKSLDMFDINASYTYYYTSNILNHFFILFFLEQLNFIKLTRSYNKQLHDSIRRIMKPSRPSELSFVTFIWNLKERLINNIIKKQCLLGITVPKMVAFLKFQMPQTLS